MPDPDSGGTSFLESFLASFIITFILTIGIYGYSTYNQDRSIKFYGIIVLFVLIVSYVLVFFSNLAIQFNNCGKNDYGNAALGALPVLGTSAIALFISYFNSCRIPIASVLAEFQWFKIESKKNSKSCCKPDIDITELERKHPMVKILSCSFYLLFAMLFGLSIGNGKSAIC